MKDSAGVIYVPSPYFNLPPPPQTVLTRLNQKRHISSVRTIFAWNILIFPDFKELGVKFINDFRKRHPRCVCKTDKQEKNSL